MLSAMFSVIPISIDVQLGDEQGAKQHHLRR